MGIKDLNKKYDLKDIVKGESIFCASGITSGDLMNGVIKKDIYILKQLKLTAIQVINKKRG